MKKFTVEMYYQLFYYRNELKIDKKKDYQGSDINTSITNKNRCNMCNFNALQKGLLLKEYKFANKKDWEWQLQRCH